MATKKSYNIVPDIRLLVDIGSANYTVPEAISELIANSMDARFEEGSLEIFVEIGPEEISIVDNGVGMTENVLGESLRLSAQMDQVTGNTSSRKGMYGLGMKAACSSLGKVWKIVTRPPNDQNEYSVSIDLDSWLEQTDRRAWKVDVETNPYDPTGPLGNRKHGTAIVVSLLRESFTMPTAVSEKLGMAYKPHLESGDVIWVGEHKVTPKTFDLLEGRRWDIDIPVGEYRVTGWYGLDNKTHNDGLYGLNIYRLGQLVEPWNKDFFRQHLMSSRVVGEIDLPFINANFHKLGFYKGSEEWKLVKIAMAELLKPVVRASGEMAKNKNDDLRQAKAIKGLDAALGFANGAMSPSSDSFVSGENASANSPTNPTSGKTNVANVDGDLEGLRLDGESFTLSYTFQELPEEIPWDFVYDRNTGDLQAVINTKSRVYAMVDDEAFFGALALAEAVMGFLIRERGYKFERARDVRDHWLFLALRSDAKAGRATGR